MSKKKLLTTTKRVIKKSFKWLTATRRRKILSSILATLIVLTSIRWIFIRPEEVAAGWPPARRASLRGLSPFGAEPGSESGMMTHFFVTLITTCTLYIFFKVLKTRNTILVKPAMLEKD